MSPSWLPRVAFLMVLVLAAGCITLWLALARERSGHADTEDRLREAQEWIRASSGRTFESPSFEIWLLDQVELQALPSVDDDRVFAREPLTEAEIDDADSLFAACHDRFLLHRELLSRRWAITDDATLQALFYMNLVSRLWGFGNARPEHYRRMGCVGENEVMGFATRDREPTVAESLASDIGCCQDHARLLALLLDRAGITNRRVQALQHVFNEAELGGSWTVLDATLNLWFDHSWEAIQTRTGEAPNAFKVTVFPHHGMVALGNPHYRPRVGHFRLEWLLRAVKKTAPVTRTF